MLRFLRRGQRWLTAVIVGGVGVVFVFFMGWGAPRGGGMAGGTLVQVGPHRFGIREFERVRAQREEEMRQAAGDSYDPDAFREPLDDLAVRTLVDRAVLALEAERMGLTTSNREIERMLLATGAFRGPDGRFDRAAFRDYVEYEYGNERNFLTSRRLAFDAAKMMELLHGIARVSDAEARESLRLRLEEVRLAFVALGPGEAVAAEEIPQERVDAFLAERDEEVRALYDARRDQYDVPEQVRARHVLLRVPRDASPEQTAEVEARARALLERIRGGEDFAAVAAEASEDPGSKDQGGDLGFFPRGRMVPAFEEAAFSLAPGEVSDLVRSDFGFHIIRVEEHRDAEQRPYESVREELARELLAREAAQAGARATAERLAAAIRDGASLESAARAEELTLQRTGLLKRRPDGFVPGLGAAQDLMATAFALEPGESSDRIFTVGDTLALIQVLERRPPAPAEIEAGLEKERTRLLEEKRSAIANAWVASRREELRESGDLQVDLAALPR
jgi:peptidyl-prolyl cis-trans isomerase D